MASIPNQRTQLTQLALFALTITAFAVPSPSWAAGGTPCAADCGGIWCPECAAAPYAGTEAQQPSDVSVAPEPSSAPQLAFSEQSGVFGGSTFSSPNMIGDFFGPTIAPTFVDDNRFGTVQPQPGGTVGRIRLSDNNSALPQDRIFFDYNYFSNVPLTTSGVDVNRFTLGFERTFLNGQASIEALFPISSTLDNNVFVDGTANPRNGEFGNIQLVTKFLLHRTATHAVAAGLGIAVPTADDLIIRGSRGEELLRVQNEAVYLTPYLAMLYTPNCDWFAHAFVQADVAAGGDTVVDSAFSEPVEVGPWNNQTYLFVDVGVGHWLVRDDSICHGLSAVAITTELHYTNSVSDADFFATPSFFVGSPDTDLDLLNGTVGTHLRWGQRLMTTFGYSFPFTASDRIFDGEARVFINRWF